LISESFPPKNYGGIRDRNSINNTMICGKLKQSIQRQTEVLPKYQAERTDFKDNPLQIQF
jgi:hypothetical protein